VVLADPRAVCNARAAAWLGGARWIGWNTLLFSLIFDAHGLVPRRGARGRIDGAVRDLPLRVHWQKGILWCIFTGARCGFQWRARVRHIGYKCWTVKCVVADCCRAGCRRRAVANDPRAPGRARNQHLDRAGGLRVGRTARVQRTRRRPRRLHHQRGLRRGVWGVVCLVHLGHVERSACPALPALPPLAHAVADPGVSRARMQGAHAATAC
jgi:hypothetical protein